MKIRIVEGLEVSVPLENWTIQEFSDGNFRVTNNVVIESPHIFFEDRKFGFLACDAMTLQAETPSEVKMFGFSQVTVSTDRLMKFEDGDKIVFSPGSLVFYGKKDTAKPQL